MFSPLFPDQSLAYRSEQKGTAPCVFALLSQIFQQMLFLGVEVEAMMWHVLWCVWCTDCLWVVDSLPLAAPDLIPGSACSPENAEAPHSASHRALQAAIANLSPGVLRDTSTLCSLEIRVFGFLKTCLWQGKHSRV